MRPAELPSMTALLARPDVVDLIDRHGRTPVVSGLRGAVETARRDVLDGGSADADGIVAAATRQVRRWEQRRCRPVINATGVVLHTNLGRAPLSAAAGAAAVAAAGPVNLEYDLVQGERGRRGALLHEALAELCGAEAATVVNNGAAALVLALSALTRGRDVVVSRGELIEIGGSFRLPDMIEASGVVLREVGTTNRTRAGDYEAAVGASTGAILRVHPSNYRVVGFTARPTTSEVAAVAHRHGIPFVHDLGSGLIEDEVDLLGDEPSARAALEDGADLVVFSGDKLLGGPQAGVIAGDASLVSRCDRHPLARTFRLDKLRIAALEATVDAHRRGDRDELPVWQALRIPVDVLRERAERIGDRTGGVVVTTKAVVGGGTAPGVGLPSVGVRLPGDGPALLAALRRGDPPVIGRLVDGDAVLDLRTVPADRDDTLAAVVAAVHGSV